MIQHLAIDSPLGPLLLAASDAGLVALYFDERRHPPESGAWTPASDAGPVRVILDDARAQLGEYFAGTRRAFTVPLAPNGTPFQQRVWAALVAIPFGATASYAELARRLDVPKAARAVGAANGRNPISIIVPCHRLVGTGGVLTGYGGGVERKRWLLAHERPSGH